MCQEIFGSKHRMKWVDLKSFLLIGGYPAADERKN